MNGKKCKQLRKIYYRAYDPNVLFTDIRINEKMGRELTNIRRNQDGDIRSFTYVNHKDSARVGYQKAKAIVYGRQLP